MIVRALKRAELETCAISRITTLSIGKQVDANADSTYEDSYRYVYDSDPRKGGLDDIVLVYDDSGNLISRNLHGPGLDNILAVEDASGETHWAHTDHLGSVRDWATYDDSTDTTTLSSETNFDSYGIVLSTTGTVPDLGFTYGYTGQEWDSDIGLSYYYNRWYDASVGRFVSEDPIGFAGGDENLAGYVFNTPVNEVDPSGLQSVFGGMQQEGSDYAIVLLVTAL